MNDKRFWSGVFLTAVWLLFLGYMLLSHSHPDSLNEWGDVFAGFFAPVAFLWLVLGYMQQGEELRNSTAALNLQADELRNSVEQQSQLVEVSRQQMKQELESLQEERERRRDAARPKFVFRHGGTASGTYGLHYTIQIINVGNTATNLILTLDPPVGGLSCQGIELLDRNQTLPISVVVQTGFSTIAALTYMDADGLPGKVHVSIAGSDSGHLSLGQVERVA